MNNSTAKYSIARLLLIVVFSLTLLVACSNNTSKPSTADLTSAESNARQAALAAQQELPKQAKSAEANLPQNPPQAAAQENAALQPAPVSVEPVQPTAVQPAALAQPVAELAGAQPAAAQPAAPSAVDPSIPVGPQKGLRAPDLTLQTLDGQSIRLSDLLGRPVVISYWATWCVPCKQELPILQRIQQEYQGQGLTILSVNASNQDDLDAVRTLVSEMGMTFPVLLDQNNQFADTYQALFFPTTYYIDANGVIRDIKLGDSSEADLRQKIQGLVMGGL